ncbi:hypothetical protein ACIHCM_16265 [Streptomyces sp. NPDC052023]|uniref:hypothetical protein n=1 Tax=Streptomyces sp. NPDC052023 TaxID=3365681 RepID=UPI0037D225FF
MKLSARTRNRAGIAALAALTLAGGAVGCGAGKGDGASGSRSVQQVLTVAYEKTAEAKSAKVEMTMSMPAGMDDMTMSGVMGWDPTVMDVTMKGSMLGAEPDMPDAVRMVWRDEVMYMDMGDSAALEMDGKSWMKLDLKAAAEAAGDPALTRQMTSGLDNMNQSPAEQIALLLESPNLKHVGSEKVDGVDAEHYKGTLTVKEMMESNKSLDFLEPGDRKQLLENVEKSGIKGYDTEVWVNEDDLPVRMDVTMTSSAGDVDMSMKLSDYGAKAEVEVPPAAETFDLIEMLEGLGEAASGEGAFGEDAPEMDLSGLEGPETGSEF